jgi:hypothetical protein
MTPSCQREQRVKTSRSLARACRDRHNQDRGGEDDSGWDSPSDVLTRDEPHAPGRSYCTMVLVACGWEAGTKFEPPCSPSQHKIRGRWTSSTSHGSRPTDASGAHRVPAARPVTAFSHAIAISQNPEARGAAESCKPVSPTVMPWPASGNNRTVAFALERDSDRDQ